MALSFGWKKGDVRESIWREDKALRNISAAALAAWHEDGDASHLRPFAMDGQPTIITFRTLKPDELRTCQGILFDNPDSIGAWRNACLKAFRLAADFPDMPDEIPDPKSNGTGARKTIKKVIKEGSYFQLSDEVIAGIEAAYPLLIDFYGGLILKSSSPTPAEKKASSQPSTPTPSSAVEANPDVTGPSLGTAPQADA